MPINVVHDEPLHSSWAHHHMLVVKQTRWSLLHLLTCCCIAQSQRDTAVVVAHHGALSARNNLTIYLCMGQQNNDVTQILQHMLQHSCGRASVSMFHAAACITCSPMLLCIWWHASHLEMPHFACPMVLLTYCLERHRKEECHYVAGRW